MTDRPLDDPGMREEHLRELGMLLLGIAHEMSTPLGVVVSTCDGQRRCLEKVDAIVAKPVIDADDHEELRSVLSHLAAGRPVLDAGLQRLEALVRELRLRGRADPGDPLAPVDLVEVLEGDLLLLHYQLKQGIAVERRFEARPRVNAHAVFLGQAFLNLMRNAIQAMDGQGTLTVTVRAKDGEAEVTVADTGPGLAPEVLERLFRESVTTKCPDEGTGIGLVTTHKIIVKHGGGITAANGPDGGAVFTVTLPLA